MAATKNDTSMIATEQKNYLLADNGRIQVWANYANSTVWVIRNGELVTKIDNATLQDVEKVLHDAGF